MAAFVRQSRPLAVGMPLQRKMLRQLRARSAPKLSYLESQPIFRISGLVEALFEQRLDVFLRCGTFDRVEAGIPRGLRGWVHEPPVCSALA